MPCMPHNRCPTARTAVLRILRAILTRSPVAEWELTTRWVGATPRVPRAAESWGALQVPAVRARPALFAELSFEVALARRQILFVIELLHRFAAVDVDDAQLVSRDSVLPCLVAHVAVTTLEPPKHT